MQARNRKPMQEDVRGTIQDDSWVNRVVRNWAPLVGNIKDPHKRNATAILLNNQYNFVRGALNEDTLTGNIATYTKYLFPAIRRIFPNLIANELVSIQPMTGPYGAVFYYEAKYATTKGSITAGDKVIQTFSANYSSEKIDEESVGTGDGTNYGGAGLGLNATLNWKPVRPLDSTNGISVTITATNPDDSTQVVVDDGSGSFGGAGTGTVNYTTGRVSNLKFTDAPADGATIVAVYWYNNEMNDQVPEINIEISMEVVKATERRMRARWSSTAQEDMKSMYGLDAEQELVAIFSNQMALEVDREIINDLISNASYTDSYDLGGGDDPNEINRIRGLLTVISTMSAQIHTGSMRAPANWIVTSPKIAAYMQQLTTHGDFAPLVYAKNVQNPYGGDGMQTHIRQPSYGPMSSDFGVQAVGTLFNRMMVYIDPLMANQTTILVGLKGQSYLDSGYVYAPYVPMKLTQTLEDPDDFSARKGIKMRYAKKLLRPEFYGVIDVTLP